MAKLNPIFAVGKYENIEPAIKAEKIKYPAYVVCTDDETFAFVDKDSNIRRIKGYEQSNIFVVDALPTDNIRTDAFYIYNGVGYLYIDGVPVPVFNNNGDSVTSYDQLENVPIVNKYGEIDSPIVIADLDNGSYSIYGQYQIGGNLETIYVTSQKTIFLVDSDENNKYITKFDADNIFVYTVNLSTANVTINEYVTRSWILSQGYTNTDYVNQAINDLYNRIVTELLVTKVSQLENDLGYLKAEDLGGISEDSIASLF